LPKTRVTNIFALAISVLGVSACGLFKAPPAPTPQKISVRVDLLESGTIIHVVDLVPMDVPNPTQPKVVNTAAFRVTHDVRSVPGNLLVIPQNALITGSYSNDGKTCQVSWQAIYYDYRSLELNQPILGVADRTLNNKCDPKLGIKPGEAMDITFKN